MSGQVFILGSGFSRAINERMPTLRELSALVVDTVRTYGRTPIPGQGTPLERDFERWLTYLADAPPWLDDGDALRNRAAFAAPTGLALAERIRHRDHLQLRRARRVVMD